MKVQVWKCTDVMIIMNMAHSGQKLASQQHPSVNYDRKPGLHHIIMKSAFRNGIVHLPIVQADHIDAQQCAQCVALYKTLSDSVSDWYVSHDVQFTVELSGR